ncbi:thiamine pyrophosphate enzyme [Paraphoma chrysanthemicola]|uniref:Pyruvate decarboxylase n=1 Tax=Paraphoma chrysanthemicola TaxID=798071 RepID=A0A8K0VWH8_9PLEO|nr:thiamine pyrophosphate enzyme [Paraphoma chrysanthemicola]
MSKQIPLASYLFTRLYQLNVRSIHGVPGDFNLTLLDFIAASNLLWVGNTNELNAGYAADAYGRMARLSALITTFGVGELSAMNAIAGAYAERSPVVHIVGAPDRAMQDARVRVHHTFNDGEFGRFKEMYRHVSAAQADLKDEATAGREIDRVLGVCVQESRPVYILIPADMVGVLVDAERLDTPVERDWMSVTPHVSEAVGRVLDRMYAAKRPVILFDGECRALRLTQDVQDIIRTTKWPTWTTSFGRGLIDESLPNFQGIYKGSFDTQTVRDVFATADLVLIFGPHFSTTNSYGLTAIPSPAVSITFTNTKIAIGATYIRDVPAKPAVSLLLKRLLHSSSKLEPTPHPREILNSLPWHQSLPTALPAHSDDTTLTHATLWPLFRTFIRPGDILLGETGTAGYGVRELKTPPNVRIFSPATWLSIGVMLPYAQGAALAYTVAILFIGDGRFQMTVQELSIIIRHSLNVVVVLLNNAGYTIERAIHGVYAPYNDIASWNYLAAPAFFGAAAGTFTARAETRGSLRQILLDEDLRDGEGLRMVEVVLNKEDVPVGPLSDLMRKELERVRAGE